MHLTKGLFSAEEAFARLGQLREEGCLVVVSANGTSRIFTRDANVVNALSGNLEGPLVLETCFEDLAAWYTWIPGAKAPREIMSVNINGHVLKAAVAKDIHLSVTARVKLDSVAPSTSPAKKKTVHYFLLADDDSNQKYPFNKGTLIVGREETCDIIIPQPGVSRRHCLFQLIPRGLSFRDLESSNGVFINGIRAKDGFVHPGDRLSLGSHNLIVQKETN